MPFCVPRHLNSVVPAFVCHQHIHILPTQVKKKKRGKNKVLCLYFANVLAYNIRTMYAPLISPFFFSTIQALSFIERGTNKNTDLIKTASRILIMSDW